MITVNFWRSVWLLLMMKVERCRSHPASASISESTIARGVRCSAVQCHGRGHSAAPRCTMTMSSRWRDTFQQLASSHRLVPRPPPNTSPPTSAPSLLAAWTFRMFPTDQPMPSSRRIARLCYTCHLPCRSYPPTLTFSTLYRFTRVAPGTDINFWGMSILLSAEGNKTIKRHVHWF